MNNYNERLYSPAKFADLTPYSEESIRRRCREGRISGARKDGKMWLIPESSLRRLGVAATPEVRTLRLSDDPIAREAFYRKRDCELMRKNRTCRGIGRRGKISKNER